MAPTGQAGELECHWMPTMGRWRQRGWGRLALVLAGILIVAAGLEAGRRSVRLGVFLLKAAVLSSAERAKGLDAVFRSVGSSAGGSWLLALLASGMVCYGLYCLVEARYRDLTPGR